MSCVYIYSLITTPVNEPYAMASAELTTRILPLITRERKMIFEIVSEKVKFLIKIEYEAAD